MAEDSVVNTPEVVAALKRALASALGDKGIDQGLKRAALHLIARAKAICPEDTTTLVQSIHSSGKVETTGDTKRIEVGAHAFSGDENYAITTHEEQEYDGPNCGGSRTMGLGPKTEAKGVSAVEPTDGSAGGKYMARPIQNKPEVYAEIIARTIHEVLDKGGL